MSGITDFADKLEAANRQYMSAFEGLTEQPPGTFTMFAQDIGPATGESLNVGFVDPTAPVRVQKPGEDKTADELRAYGVNYLMETLYKRHKLARRRIQYDPSGRVGKAVQAFAEEDVFIFNERVWSKIVANTLTGPDGVALFSTAHPHAPGGGTQSNLTTNALSFSSFRAGMQAMQGFQRENGSYVRSRATHLFVPPSLEATAKEVAGADKPVNVTSGGALDGGANVVGVTAIANVYDGEVMVVVEPHMEDDPDMWILADLSKTGKPYTFAPGEEVVPSVTDTTDSDQVRLKDEFDFILQGDLITGPGHWQLCYAGKPS